MKKTETAFVIVPGGASPHAPSSKPVYDLLVKTAGERGYQPYLLDFVGCGHEPTVQGRELRTSVTHLARHLEPIMVRHEKVVVHGQSYGCTVTAALAVDRPDLLQKVERMVWWAPVSRPIYEQYFGDANKVRELNTHVRQMGRGGVIDENFIDTMRWLEDLIPSVNVPRLILAVGEHDQLSSRNFLNLLAASTAPQTSVQVCFVPNAVHEVGECIPGYLDAIFSP